VLTDSKIRTLPSPKGKTLKATDANGLYLEFRPSGRKVWIYRYRIDGKESLFTLGEYPTATVPRAETAQEREARMKAGVFTLAEARAERDKARLLVLQGINPSAQRKLDTAKAGAVYTFSALAANWIEEDGKQWTERYRQQVTNRLKQDAFPTLGNLNIQDITSQHVGDMLATVKARSPTAAKHLQAWAGAVFRFAAKKALIDNDPSYPWRGSIKGHKVEHHPPLPEKNLPAFLRAMDKTSAEFQTIMAAKLLLYTVCRSVEVREAQWPEIDLDAARWDIPADRMKAREPHTVPLCNQALTLLKTLKELTGEGKYLFPHRSDRHKPLSHEALRDYMRRVSVEAGYTGRFTPHGIRSTFSTLCNEKGMDIDLIEKCLAHKERNDIRNAYNRSTRLPEREKHMQWWADFLDGLKKGADVIPIKRAG